MSTHQSSTGRRVMPGWTAIIVDRRDAEQFGRDLNRLRTLGAACMDAAAATTPPRWYTPTIYHQLVGRMTPAVRAAVFTPHPSFSEIWNAL